MPIMIKVSSGDVHIFLPGVLVEQELAQGKPWDLQSSALSRIVHCLNIAVKFPVCPLQLLSSLIPSQVPGCTNTREVIAEGFPGFFM